MGGALLTLPSAISWLTASLLENLWSTLMARCRRDGKCSAGAEEYQLERGSRSEGGGGEIIWEIVQV